MSSTSERTLGLMIQAHQLLQMQHDELVGARQAMVDQIGPESPTEKLTFDMLESKFDRVGGQMAIEITRMIDRQQDRSLGLIDRLRAWVQSANRDLDRLLEHLETDNGKGKRL